QCIARQPPAAQTVVDGGQLPAYPGGAGSRRPAGVIDYRVELCLRRVGGVFPGAAAPSGMDACPSSWQALGDCGQSPAGVVSDSDPVSGAASGGTLLR